MGMLRQLFGASKDDIWRQFSQQVGATFEQGGTFGSSKLRLQHRQWEITLDTYVVNTGNVVVTLTRLRAPYVNPDGQRFRIYRAGAFSWLGRLLGSQDIEIGDSSFD